MKSSKAANQWRTWRTQRASDVYSPIRRSDLVRNGSQRVLGIPPDGQYGNYAEQEETQKAFIRSGKLGLIRRCGAPDRNGNFFLRRQTHPSLANTGPEWWMTLHGEASPEWSSRCEVDTGWPMLERSGERLLTRLFTNIKV
jgi:hypothetical protein